MTSEITRVTMIKIEKEEHIPTALKGFEAFTKAQERNGNPYILSMQAGPAYGHVREQGYNFVAKTVFKNKEDMEFYEKECAGHEAYKVFLRENAPVSGLMTVYFTPGVSYDI